MTYSAETSNPLLKQDETVSPVVSPTPPTKRIRASSSPPHNTAPFLTQSPAPQTPLPLAASSQSSGVNSFAVSSTSSLLSQWLALANYYARSDAGVLGQHHLYACAYYQCALAEYHAHPSQYPDINPDKILYPALIRLKQQLIAELSERPISTGEQLQAIKQPAIKQNLIEHRTKYKDQLAQLHIADSNLSEGKLEVSANLLKEINDIVKNILIKLWIDSASELQPCLGSFPCNYALIAFGSLADGLATLHSDLEFGILIEDIRHKEYFHKVSQLMQFNTILLGETTLRILRPPEYDKQDYADLFKHCRIKNGISFDGVGPGGGKNPLGPREPPFYNGERLEFIGTPQVFSQLQLREDVLPAYHTLLTDILQVSYLVGTDNRVLFTAYCQQANSLLHQVDKASPAFKFGQYRALTQLRIDAERFFPRLGREEKHQHTVSLKYDLLRLLTLAIRQLALYAGQLPMIESDTNFVTLLLRLEQARLISSNARATLQQALSLSGILRLQDYLIKDSQTEASELVTTLHLTSSENNSLSRPLLENLYSILIPFYQSLLAWLADSTQTVNILQFDFVPASPAHPFVQGMIHEALLEFGEAQQAYQQVLEESPQPPDVYKPGTILIPSLEQYETALHFAYRQAAYVGTLSPEAAQRFIAREEDVLRKLKEQSKDSLTVAVVTFSLAEKYADQQNYQKAILYAEQGYQTFSERLGAGHFITHKYHAKLIDMQYQAQAAQDHPLLKPLYEAYLRRQRETAIQQGLAYYIVPEVSKKLHGRERCDLQAQLHAFLQQRESKLLVLLGDSGSGKSLSLHYFERALWTASNTENKAPEFIPLFIELKSLHNIREKDFLPEFLEKHYGYTLKQIYQLKQLYHFIFIFDGYDELSGICQNGSLYQDTVYGKWNHPKVIISCRTQFFRTQEACNIVMSTSPDARNDYAYWYIAPFNMSRIQAYLSNYIARRATTPPDTDITQNWTVEQYLSYYQSVSGLTELISSPLLLRIVTEAIPILHINYPYKSAGWVTRYEVYQAFIRQWFTREVEKQHAIIPFASENPEQILQSFELFACELAAELWEASLEQQKGLILEVHYQPTAPRESFQKRVRFVQASRWERFFTDHEPRAVRARTACPLCRMGDYHYSFIHKSFVEYFVAVYLLKEIEELFNSDFTNLPALLFSQGLLTSEPAIIQFLAEQIQTDEDKQHWFHIVEYSRKANSKMGLKPNHQEGVKSWKTTQNAIKTAASNAIMVLNYAGVSFTGHYQNLSGIRIKGADLSQGIFHQTNFQQANLKQVQFQRAYLRQASLKQCKMQGTIFGEQAYLKQNYRIECMVFSPDGKQLAAGSDNGKIYLLDWQSGSTISVLDAHQARVTCLAWHAEQPLLASGSSDKRVRLWDTTKGHLLYELATHQSEVNCLVWQDIQLASCDGRTIQLWDTCFGQKLLEIFTEAHVLAWKETFLASSELYGQKIKLWDSKTGKILRELCLNEDWYVLYFPAWQDKQLISYSMDSDMHSKIQWWDVETGTLIKEVTSPAFPCTQFALQGTKLALGGNCDSRFSTTVIDITTGGELCRLRGHRQHVTCVAWRGADLVSASSDGTIRVWNATSGNQLRERELREHPRGIICIAWQGTQLASAHKGGLVRLWDTSQARVRYEWHRNQYDEISCFDWHPSQPLLVLGSNNGIVQLREISSGKVVHELCKQPNKITCLTWHPNKLLLAVGSSEGMIQIWDMSTYNKLCEWRGHQGGITCFAWQNICLASGSEDRMIRLWDTKTGKELLTLSGPTGSITCLAWESNQLAGGASSGRQTGTIWIWDTATGEKLADFGYEGIIQLIYRNSHLISWNKEGEITLWENSGRIIQQRQLNPILRANYNGTNLATLDDNNGISYWHAFETSDAVPLNPPRLPNWQLQWTTRSALDVSNVDVTNATGLSVENQQLLKQRGATGL